MAISLSFTDAKTAINATIEAGDYTPTYLVGPPGVGKTSLALDVAEHFGIPRTVAEACMFRPSLHDPVDLNA